jgi:hypothetical protein
MLVALAALFVSLGGVSYGLATGSIDSREIKNNTIRTRDIRNNEVRGRDIRNSTIRTEDIGANQVRGADVLESSLGLVPAANTANSASTAGSLSSQQKIAYQAAPGTGSQDIYDSGKLKLTASCSGAGGGTLTLTASTAVPNATLQSDAGGTSVNESDFDASSGLPINQGRTIVYTEPGGEVVVLHYAAVDGGAYNGTVGCLVKGLAQRL